MSSRQFVESDAATMGASGPSSLRYDISVRLPAGDGALPQACFSRFGRLAGFADLRFNHTYGTWTLDGDRRRQIAVRSARTFASARAAAPGVDLYVYAYESGRSRAHRRSFSTLDTIRRVFAQSFGTRRSRRPHGYEGRY